MSLRPDTSDAPGKTEISYFVLDIIASILLYDPFQEHIFGFDISVNEIFFVDQFEALHDFYCHLQGMVKGKTFARKAGLVSQKVSHFTVLHNNDDEVVG